MTLEQLQALADDQLIEKVAHEVMGWEKKPLTFPLMGVEKCDKTGEDVIYWYEGEKFKHAVSKYYCHGELDDSYDVIDERFRPLTDWNHTMEVVKELCGRRFKFTMYFDVVGVSVVAEDQKELAKSGFAKGSSPQRAICLAALLATDIAQSEEKR